MWLDLKSHFVVGLSYEDVYHNIVLIMDCKIRDVGLVLNDLRQFKKSMFWIFP